MKKLLERGLIALMVTAMVCSGIILPGQSYNAYATETAETTPTTEQTTPIREEGSPTATEGSPTTTEQNQTTESLAIMAADTQENKEVIKAAELGQLGVEARYDTNIKCGEETVFELLPVNGSGEVDTTVTWLENDNWPRYKYLINSIDIRINGVWTPEVDCTRLDESHYWDTKLNKFAYKFMFNGQYRISLNVMDFGTQPLRQSFTSGDSGKYIYVTVNDPNGQTIEQFANEIVTQCSNGNPKNDYEKALWLENYLVSNAEYDYYSIVKQKDGYNYISEERTKPYLGYVGMIMGESGVLKRGIGTCESYHRALSLLLNKVGIPTYRVEGDGHVWTLAKLDGEWTHIDSTWDSKDTHIYFGLTDEQMIKVHPGMKKTDGTARPLDESLLKATSYKNNYIVNSGGINSYANQIKQEITSQTETAFNVKAINSSDPTTYQLIYPAVANYLTNNAQIVSGDKVAKVTYNYDSDNYKNSYYSVEFVPREIIESTPIRITSATATSPVNYTGGAVTPAVTVMGADGKVLVLGQDYTVTYSNNVNIGRGTATITGAGNYTGTLQTEFQIGPKGTSLKKLKKQKKAFTVKWGRQKSKMPKSRVTGYQIRYSTSPAFPSGGTKIKTVKKYTKSSCKIKKLSRKARYYVQVRTYMKTSGGTFYSTWSAAKSVVTR